MCLTELRKTSSEDKQKTQQGDFFHPIKVGNYLDKLPFECEMSFDDFVVFKCNYKPVIA